MSFQSREGGLTPLVVGGLSMVFGFISVFTCFGSGGAIIDTGSGNVANVITSLLTMLFGFLIWRSGNKLAAVIFAMLLISLVVYGNFKFDGKRAVSVAAAASSAAVNAAGSAVTAAGGAAIDSVGGANVGNSVTSSGGLKGGHRWLTQKELSWCATKQSKSKGCVTKQCAVNKCGVKGK